ncbi:hypothetical protein [Streptomyces sp. TLI_146]|uniref:hypothetical protein n=1 Tax=Streptomyces sp. TLI_146 TaxID=1938858 RepID=UPI000C701494|nr:hypothetical protein [Streptomyces sp. TLI_146]PKV89363.1 hypothetical protein BX283_6999 [Streptomyces sp. TLI_146]
MARAGRPQGAPKGRTEAANELARLLCEVTRGLTVRELAQRYGGGKTAWSEYRSGARIIALGRLNTVLKDQIRTPRLQGLLTEARRLHDLALTAEAAARPVPSVEEALRQSRADLAESGRLVENLLAMVTLLRERVENGGAGSAGADALRPGTSSAPSEGRSADTPPEEAESAAAEQVRLRLDQAVDQLAAARSVQAAARRAVADAEAQREAGSDRPVEFRPENEELVEAGTVLHDRPLPDAGPVPAGTSPDAEPPGSAPPAARHRIPPVADATLSVELVRIGNTLKQQRSDARWLWKQVRRLPSAALPGPVAPASFRPYVVEGVVLERLDKSVVPASRAPAPRAALPAVRDPRPGQRGRRTLAVLGTVTVLALLAAATLTGVLLGRHHTASAPGTAVRQAPGSVPLPSGTGPAAPSPSASASLLSASPSPSPSQRSTRAPGSRSAPTPSGRAPAPPLPSLVPPPNPPSERASGTAYVISQDRRNVLRWTTEDRSWKVIGPAADQIYAGAAGLFATNPGDGRISKYDEPSRSWSQIGFPGEQFVTAGDGLYAITEHRDAVVRWTGVGGEWVRIGGPAARLYAGGAGLFAASPDTGALFRYSGYGDTWVDAGGPGADFAVGPDYVARLSPDGKEIWQANGRGSGWRRIGGAAVKLHAGGAGLFATDAVSGQILKYGGVPGSWTPIGAAGAALAVTGNSVYRIAADGPAVSRWTGRGSEWVPLGTTASAIAATD